MNDLKSRKGYINTNCERKYPGVKDYYLRCVSDEVIDRLRKESLDGVCFLSLSDLREAYDLTKSEGLKVMLLIDDEPDILRTNRRYLEARGYQVDTAVCAADALKRLGRQGYDCILLDVLLPDMNGYKLCEAVRSLTSAPILFLSCMDDEADKGADGRRG